MYCPQCGSQIPQDVDFCPQCGTKIAQPAEKCPQPESKPTQVMPTPQAAEKPRQPTVATQPLPATSTMPRATSPYSPSALPPQGAPKKRSGRGPLIAAACAAVALVGVGLWFCIADPADVFGHGPRSQAEAAQESQRQAQEAADAKQAQKEAEEAAKEAQAKQEEAEKRAQEAEEAQKEAQGSPSAETLEAGVVRRMDDPDDYALYDTHDKVFTAEELDSLTDFQLFVVRNEIFARYGRRFSDDTLAMYFDTKSWYVPLYDGEEFDQMPSPLTAAEKANCETLLALEQSRNSPYLQAH